MKLKNVFAPGNQVKIGFMTLIVIRKADEKEYYRPYPWILESSKGIKYLFTPYFGLERL